MKTLKIIAAVAILGITQSWIQATPGPVGPTNNPEKRYAEEQRQKANCEGKYNTDSCRKAKEEKRKKEADERKRQEKEKCPPR